MFNDSHRSISLYSQSVQLIALRFCGILGISLFPPVWSSACLFLILTSFVLQLHLMCVMEKGFLTFYWVKS